MVNSIIELALANGLWAAMFVFLFVYQLKDGKKREEKYIKIINDLSQNLIILENVEKIVLDIQSGVKCEKIQEKIQEKTIRKNSKTIKKSLAISEENVL